MLADTVGEITYPIVRDMDTNCYERQHGGDMEVGSYAHRAILMDADEIPSIAESKLSPTELPFTQEDFELQMEQALELIPDILGDERVGIRHADQRPAVADPGRDADPRRDARGQGPLGRRRDLDQGGARDRPDGRRVDDRREARDRPARLATSPASTPTRRRATTSRRARPRASTRPTASSTRPSSGRATATSGSARSTRRERELGAVFFETAGWERPFWYDSNAPLLEEYGDRVMPRDAEWESRWWSPIINAEHLAMRDRVGMVDLSAFAIFDITGPGRARPRPADGRRPDGRARSAGSSTRRCSTRPAASSPT